MDALFALIPPRNIRRFVQVVLFAGLVVVFRRLLVLLVFFVMFERVFGVASEWLSKRGLHKKATVGVLAIGTLGVIGTAIALGLGRVIRDWVSLRGSLEDRIAAVRETSLYQALEDRLSDANKLVEGAQHYAGEALKYAAEAGHVLLFALIGFILAVVYLLEREEIEAWGAGLNQRSWLGTYNRWLGHVADAISVTLQFQVVVAACNAILTFPVLIFIGVPHKVTLLFMIFFSGMVPVVGNFIAGAILTMLAYQAKGWLGVVLFTVLTFVLHKLESYYLNPRLARRHVHLPGFVLIVSLLLWEQLVGFVGLFVSFPFLFIALRIHGEWKAEDAARGKIAAAASTEDQAAE